MCGTPVPYATWLTAEACSTDSNEHGSKAVIVGSPGMPPAVAVALGVADGVVAGAGCVGAGDAVVIGTFRVPGALGVPSVGWIWGVCCAVGVEIGVVPVHAVTSRIAATVTPDERS